MPSKQKIKELQQKFQKTKPISKYELDLSLEDAARIDFYNRDKYKKAEKQAQKKLALGEIRIDHSPYYIYKVKDDYTGKVECMASPLGKGDDVFSNEDWSSYRMTHGGSKFRKAAEICDEIYSDENTKW